MNSNDRPYDDLTVIRGIGAARQQWFREVLRVRTFEDLAALSAEEIESRLKADAQVVSRNEIGRWLAQARELAGTAEPSLEEAEAELPPTAEATISAQVPEEEAIQPEMQLEEEEEIGEPATAPAEASEWRTFATFVVNYQSRRLEDRVEALQTTVELMENGGRTESWPTLETEQLCRWMADRVDEIRDQPPREPPPAPAKSAAIVEITRVRASQRSRPEMLLSPIPASQSLSGIIISDEPATLEVSFALVGEAAAELTQRAPPYWAQFYARSVSTGARIHLGDSERKQLAEGKLTYAVRMPGATLSSGIYNLRILVKVGAEPMLLGYLEISSLQVV